MTHADSLDLDNPTTPSKSTTIETEPAIPSNLSSSPRTPTPTRTHSPRNASNRAWISEQQRREFLFHLEQWSRNHDSSAHFHGKISLAPHDPRREHPIGLGKSVGCILSDTRFTDARKQIVIRLFPPQNIMSSRGKDVSLGQRHDSLDLLEADGSDIDQIDQPSGMQSDYGIELSGDTENTITTGPYKLVIRCGASFVSAREYFNKHYFRYLMPSRLNNRSESKALDRSLKHKSQLLGPAPHLKDSITIRPLFHPFKRLPPELQDMIFTTAAGLSRNYNLCQDGHFSSFRKNKDSSAISLSTMFQISTKMNEHLVPFVYHSTDFHFGLTGFTNFLWQAGPVNRPKIRRLTFHFGKLALLHCIRWLAPDPVFELLEPPVITNPRSLQYFWRCQIQELAQQLHLHTVTVDIKNIPKSDLEMVVRILRGVFGSVERINLVETDRQGNSKQHDLDIKEIMQACDAATWNQLCMGYWERHKTHQYFYKFALMPLSREEFQALMEADDSKLKC